MKVNQLPVWSTDLSLGAKLLWTLTTPDLPAMGEVLRERMEEALAAVQDRLGVYEAELTEAGF